MLKSADVHEVEKDVVKKKMKNYEEVDIESKIAREKDTVQSNDESIQLYEDK